MELREKLFRIVNNFEPDDQTPIIDLILKEAPKYCDSLPKIHWESNEGKNLLDLCTAGAGFGFAVGYVFGQMFEVDNKEAISQVKELRKKLLRNSGLLRSLKPRLRKAGSILEEDADLIRIGEKNPEHMDYKKGFLKFCEYRRNLSENTIRSYEFDLRQFFEWLNKNHIEITSITIKDLDAFLIWLKETGIKTPTVNRHMYCLKSFYRWLMRIEAVNRNPLEAFQNAREGRRLPRYLGLKQQEALLLAAQNDKRDASWIAQRNHLMILFLLDTGVRIGELCGLQLNNMDLNEGICRVIGKGDKEREIVLSDRLRDAIRDYLAMVEGSGTLNGRLGALPASRGMNLRIICRVLGIPYLSAEYAIHGGGEESTIKRQLETYIKEKVKPLPIKYLFFNEHGKGIGQRHAFRITREIGKRGGIENFHPHLCRHTFATNLRERRAELILIKEALGHSSVSTTEMYAHVGDGRYREEMKKLVNQK